MSNGINYSIEKKDNTIYIIGNVNFNNILTIKKNCIELLVQDHVLRVDLAGVIMADSSIMLVLIELMRYSSVNFKKLTFCNVPIFVKDLCKLYEINIVLDI